MAAMVDSKTAAQSLGRAGWALGPGPLPGSCSPRSMIWRICLEGGEPTGQQSHWGADMPLGAWVAHRALPSRLPAQ